MLRRASIPFGLCSLFRSKPSATAPLRCGGRAALLPSSPTLLREAEERLKAIALARGRTNAGASRERHHLSTL